MWRTRLALNSKPTVLLIALLFFYSTWWLFLPRGMVDGVAEITLWWGSTYQIFALVGALYGFFICKHWGGTKSVLGRAVLSFSLGLLFQAVGQTISTYYVLNGLGVPYPSWGDIGFFGSIFFYAYGAILLGKVSGARLSLKTATSKLQALLVPLAMITLSSVIFLRSYQFDWSSPTNIFLDVGYPLGQAFYVSMAVIAFLVSRRILGGVMKMPIFFFIGALIMQYLSDFTFLFKTHTGTYIPGGLTDYLYLLSYFLMAFSVIQFSSVYRWIKET